MKSDREFTGTLLGFDDFVSEFTGDYSFYTLNISHSIRIDMVLEDVTE